MSNNIMMSKKILLIGASQMAIDYYNVLKALNKEVDVVGRSESSAINFEQATNHEVNRNGLDVFIKSNKLNHDFAIVAVGIEELCNTTCLLIENGVKNILVEKPGGTSIEEITKINDLTTSQNANVYIAYNRRFYTSVIKAKELITADGGPTSFNFEFTEWSHKIEPLEKKNGVKEHWFIGNSTHVVDMAFYLGGNAKEISCYSSGKLSWHEKSNFSGAGISEAGALFSYHANWQAPGRWVVEILTTNYRFIFKPLEELLIQKKGSVAIEKYELDGQIDIEFKPGLYRQTQAFLDGNNDELKSLKQQLYDMNIYTKILSGKDV